MRLREVGREEETKPTAETQRRRGKRREDKGEGLRVRPPWVVYASFYGCMAFMAGYLVSGGSLWLLGAALVLFSIALVVGFESGE